MANARVVKRGRVGSRSLRKLLPKVGTPVNAVAAAGKLTIAEPVTAEDTMTIGSVVYTFKANGTADAAREIDIGASEAATKLNIVKAIKGTDTLNSAHPTVDCAAAFVGDDLALTAKTKGVAGDAIVTTETLTHASNVFDATTLGAVTAGVDGTPGEAGEQMIDDSYLYIALTDNLISGNNWRRISLGSAY